MEILTQPLKSKHYNYKEIKTNQPKNKWFFLLFMILLIMMADKFDDFIKQNTDSSYELKPKRKKDLKKRLEKIDEAEQYALKATINGWYDCYNCGAKKKIYLYIGEVWKYGISKNGRKRYNNIYYIRNKLQYYAEFKGIYSECLKQELKQIYSYPILPQNLKRINKLARPPGNKEDY